MKDRGYQYGFSEGNPAMHGVEGRRRKAVTMVAVLKEFLGDDRLSNAKVLNIGCSTGIIDELLSEHVAQVTGIDIDSAAIELARSNRAKSNLTFRAGDAMSLDLPDASVDVVICSQVYEHVPDAFVMMREIERVLTPGGVCYFAATSRWCLVEQHYQLPFLSVIPVSWAHVYLRMLGRGAFYHERHMSLSGLRRLVAAFIVKDYTREIISEPKKYGADYLVSSFPQRAIAKAWLRLAYPLFPGFIWLLSKPG